jgi:hypothetical protein
MTSLTSPHNVVVSDKNGAATPSFIHRRHDGVFVSPAQVPSAQLFIAFIDEIFSQGLRFSGLNYSFFQSLAYPTGPTGSHKGEVLLANDIVIFPNTRKALYKEFRLMEDSAYAEYMFEPVFLEVHYQEPEYAEPDESGNAVIKGYKESIRIEPTKLNFDEFVADMWVKGVRFGIDRRAFESGIAKRKADRLVIATQLPPVQGRDAELKEECEGLHRDDSPMIKAGKADLRRFKNRFPQIAKGQHMMRKIPRQFGELGYKVTGAVMDPDIPKDIDLAKISGPGTTIQIIDNEQFIVAVADGFLSIDVQSNLISVTEKIENREGISAKTTGDLSLTVDEFIEHGEVQEGRRVDGKHMKFTSAVYGALVSAAGNIAIENNLIGGSATNPGGTIVVKKRASNAHIEAIGGSVEVSYAENCQIIGEKVHIGQAINCDIVAEQLHMELSQGCTIAARSIDIQTCGDRKDNATMVSVLIPDLQEVTRRTAELEAAVADTQTQVEAKFTQVNQCKVDPEFSKMLAIKEMLAVGKIKLTSPQEQNFRQMQTKFAPTLKTLEKLVQERNHLVQRLVEKRQALEDFKNEQISLAADRGCKIREVIGSTMVQQMPTPRGEARFSALSGKALHNLLHTSAPTRLRIFSGEHGSVEWHYSNQSAWVA